MSGIIKIVGLGSGSEEQLSLGVLKLLKDSENIYIRTNNHPVTLYLEKKNIKYETFDYLYDELDEYEEVYQKIASILIEKALKGASVIYAVPGNPMVAERSVLYLVINGEEKGINIEVLGGESFLDTLFAKLKIDPINGLLVLNGESINRSDLNSSKNIIICQVYNQLIASDIKLTLMELYPEDMIVYIISSLGISGKESIKEVPIYELDRNPAEFHHLSTLLIPSVSNKILSRDFFRLIELVKILRGPGGCPWDKAQTHQSIRKNMIEEAYELVETIDNLDRDHMVEELGDVLLQVVLHSQIAEDDGYFNIYDVLEELNNKLVRRHPHIFAKEEANIPNEALVHWENIKQKEKEEKEKPPSSSQLDGIPVSMSEIYKAYKLQKKAAYVGFDWTNIKDVFDKVEEELVEVKNASNHSIKEEIGDLIFAVINLSRFLNIDPEEALSVTNRKFIKRFKYIEKKLNKSSIPLSDASLELMETFWNEAKAFDKERDI